jgi:hypothetical protein
MGTLGTILSGLGGLAALVGTIWIVVIAFKESIAWGIGSFLCFIVLLIYVAQHWEATKKPFLIWVGGVALTVVARVIGGGGAA